MIASTTCGEVRGVRRDGVLRFLGVPYGEAPIGPLRFAPPIRRLPWSGVLDATSHGPRPPQPDMATPLGSIDVPGEMDEDCLRLNIDTPSLDGARPVMVWFHGGGLAFGSANEYDGSHLAARGDVVVVAVGYRLGLLGFADLSPCGPEHAGSASNGFRDQILALEWVREHIGAFGGDPGNVTVFGQSGGGLSILALLGSPAADGLFHRAIVLSAGPPQPAAPDVVSILAGTLDVTAEDLPARLRELPVERLLELQQGIGFTAGGCVDGTVVTRLPVDAILAKGQTGVPIIIGSTRDEGTMLTTMMQGLRPDVLRLIASGLAEGTFEGADPSAYLRALAESLGDDDVDATAFHTEVWTDHFRRTAVRVAEAGCRAGAGGWLYRFDLEPTGGLASTLGVTHAADLGFVFDTVAPLDGVDLYDPDDPDVRRVAGEWSGVLASFARHGHPGASMPEWHPYLPGHDCLLVDARSRVVSHVDAGRQRIWGDSSS